MEELICNVSIKQEKRKKNCCINWNGVLRKRDPNEDKQKDAYKVEQINKRNEPGWANNTVNDNMS